MATLCNYNRQSINALVTGVILTVNTKNLNLCPVTPHLWSVAGEIRAAKPRNVRERENCSTFFIDKDIKCAPSVYDRRSLSLTRKCVMRDSARIEATILFQNLQLENSQYYNSQFEIK